MELSRILSSKAYENDDKILENVCEMTETTHSPFISQSLPTVESPKTKSEITNFQNFSSNPFKKQGKRLYQETMDSCPVIHLPDSIDQIESHSSIYVYPSPPQPSMNMEKNANTIIDPGLAHLVELLNQFNQGLRQLEPMESVQRDQKVAFSSMNLLSTYKELISEMKGIENLMDQCSSCSFESESKKKIIKEKCITLKNKIRKDIKRHVGQIFRRKFQDIYQDDVLEEELKHFEQHLTSHLKELLDKVVKLQKVFMARMYQRNKRMNANIEMEELEKQIVELKALIQCLESCRDELQTQISNQTNWKMKQVENYVALFKRGLIPNENSSRKKQVEFVESNMIQDIKILISGNEISFYQQWKMAVATMADLRWLITDLTPAGMDGSMIRCCVTTSFRITRRLLATLYPHMLVNEGFVSTVLGKTMELDAILHFKYDTGSPSMIAAIEAEAYMLKAWIKVLKGNFQQALKTVQLGDKITDLGLIQTVDVVD